MCEANGQALGETLNVLLYDRERVVRRPRRRLADFFALFQLSKKRPMPEHRNGVAEPVTPDRVPPEPEPIADAHVAKLRSPV